MYYFEDSQSREHNVTRDIAQTYLSTVLKELELSGKVIPMFEVQKLIYGAKGDVDLLLYYEPDTETESLLVACEIKTIHLTSDGQLKSVKAKKRKTKIQLANLQEDGFDYVWLLEFIVTEPANSWFHPYAGDALFMETTTLENSNIGHAKFQISAIAGKLEADGGSIARRVIQKANRLPRRPQWENLMGVIRGKITV